ncbi:MAG TPA: protein-L-isoaspartate(D-aspartate) O-methyltransferase, partial [Planctomycetaceae bacterium]
MSVRPLFALAALLPAAALAQSRDAFEAARNRMVDEFIEAEGVTNERVLEAMRSTPRHEFVRPGDVRSAYHDAALPIGHGQTISPPFVVAYMTETIDPRPTDKVLEIGTGSGYQAAVLSPLVKEVYTIEIVDPLAKGAERKLKQLGYGNVHVKAGDGYQGWPEHAPFDKIIVTCSPEKVPTPLVEQLAEGGKLLIPLGERYQQVFYLFEKKNGKLEASKLIPTLFVPMTGISEDRRQVRPDPLRPQVVNGSFEEDANGDGRPDGWHYLRQTTLRDGDAAGGERSLVIENADPGRLAQALQGFAIDGRKVAVLEVAASLRAEDLRPGPDRT